MMFELSHPKRDMYSKDCEFGDMLLEKQVFGVANHGNPKPEVNEPIYLDYL